MKQSLKPQSLSVMAEKIPVELKELKQWVCWKYEYQSNRKKPWTKPPYDPRKGYKAKTNDSSTWTNFEGTFQAYKSGKYDGIGFALHSTDGLTGLDIDHCLNEAGELAPWAQEIMNQFPKAYWERSPSGEGLRGFCYGTPHRSGKFGPNNWLEVYQPPSHKYLTVTGQTLNGTSSIGNGQDGLDWIHKTYPSLKKNYKPKDDLQQTISFSNLADNILLEKAMNASNGADFSALWRGDISRYNKDHSAADLALCNMLAFWTSGDSSQIDRLFRSSELYRKKWDTRHFSNGQTYGEATIQKAISASRDFYKPNQSKPQKTTSAEIEACIEGAGRIKGELKQIEKLRIVFNWLSQQSKTVQKFYLDKIKKKTGNKLSLLRIALKEASNKTKKETNTDVKNTKSNWRELLRYKIKEDGSHGILLKTPSNIALILTHDERWQEVFGFDEFQNYIVLLKPLPSVEGLSLPKYENGRPIQDTDLFAVKCWFSSSEYNLNLSESTVAGAVNLIGNNNAFHPIRSYLGGLIWDKIPRLDQWLLKYMKAQTEDDQTTKYLQMIGSKWMIQAVARIYRPGCKADYVLILEGPQGVNKSTALKTLAKEEYFNDTPFNIGSKDAYLSLQGTWIYEIGELDSLMRAESSTAKAFFTSAYDKFRPPYGRLTVKNPRQCIFAGTVNGNEYIKDRTGGRRYWPVWCQSIDIKALEADRDHLWAEAVHRYKAHEKWWPEGNTEHKLCKEAQDLRILDDPWEIKITTYIEGKHKVTIGDILERGLDKDPGHWTKSDETRIGQLMQRWGWRRKRVWTKRKTNRITVYVPPEPD